MKTLKLSSSTRSFLSYGFHGNGKYYLTEQGSKHYRNTAFSNFAKSNRDCFKITDQGNDAPRGGATGAYWLISFNEKFNEKFDWFFKEREDKKQYAIVAAKEKEDEEKQIKEKFTKYIENHPEKVAGWMSEIEKLSNKKARLYKENRVGRATGNFNFWGKYRIFDEVITT